MKLPLLGIVLFSFALILSAEDMDLVKYSDLRLRNVGVEGNSLYGTWKLKGSTAGETLNIDAKRISGSDGCNRYSASVMISEENIKIGPIMSTRAMCEELNGSDEAFRITLARVATYQLLDSNELLLLDGAGKELLRFVP